MSAVIAIGTLVAVSGFGFGGWFMPAILSRLNARTADKPNNLTDRANQNKEETLQALTPLAERESIKFDIDDPRIPTRIKAQVSAVLTLVDTLEKRIVAQKTGLEGLEGGVGLGGLEVTRIRDIHLPELLDSYHAIPAEHRAEIFKATGKSAIFALADAIQTMTERLQEMSLSLANQDLKAFQTQLGFVKSKFGYEPRILDL